MSTSYQRSKPTSPAFTPAELADYYRIEVGSKLDPLDKAGKGQFLTPLPVARLLASFFQQVPRTVRLLDPGAGVGSLTAAFVGEALTWAVPPRDIDVVTYEIDPVLCAYLHKTLAACGEACSRKSIRFSFEIKQEDFVEARCRQEENSLLDPGMPPFDCVFLNPPYKKLSTTSPHYTMLREIGGESTNLYSAFMWLSARLLKPQGQFVAITPRSFCNGLYFAPFRLSFLQSMAMKRLHVFESRDKAFEEDAVLQENLATYAIREGARDTVLVSSTSGPLDEVSTSREVAYSSVIVPGDGQIIHIPLDDLDLSVADDMRAFDYSLTRMGLEVSTGRVVDFRAKEHLSLDPHAGVPLLHPHHLQAGTVRWPNGNNRKPCSIVLCEATRDLMVPPGIYVLLKRFSSKEESRRIVASVCDTQVFVEGQVAFENHLNYIHRAGHGLDRDLAVGLAGFLNSSLFDAYFRQFSGHTQVNATDLRRMRYPSPEDLVVLGQRIGGACLGESALDDLCEEVLGGKDRREGIHVRGAVKKIRQALQVLRDLDFPRAQQNERSALTLLALLGLKPTMPWSKAERPLVGITEMMEFFSEYYGKHYAPNTRETVRRQTAHQFLESGLIMANPDCPGRPINSPKWCYQVTEEAYALFRTFEADGWEVRATKYCARAGSLRAKYAQERAKERIPIVLNQGQQISLSPGGQNVLVEKILNEFCPRFLSGGTVLYVGDTDKKWAYLDTNAIEELGIRVEVHGKFPDIVLYHPGKNWLLLVEAVTSHGPVNPKRQNELRRVFKGSRAGIVYVTAFLDRMTLAAYIAEISWETEVWVAEAPDHLIHFDGETFLGPYE